ncbi:hypothetical protein NL676_021814 [Syzygium grande]|nr:hypothetical protein NL676_021814 [Syzygium grande]
MRAIFARGLNFKTQNDEVGNSPWSSPEQARDECSKHFRTQLGKGSCHLASRGSARRGSRFTGLPRRHRRQNDGDGDDAEAAPRHPPTGSGPGPGTGTGPSRREGEAGRGEGQGRRRRQPAPGRLHGSRVPDEGDAARAAVRPGAARVGGGGAGPLKPAEPKRARQAGAEPSRGAAEEEHASYADVAGILKSDGAHIPGIVNPTQLARWIHQT